MAATRVDERLGQLSLQRDATAGARALNVFSAQEQLDDGALVDGAGRVLDAQPRGLDEARDRGPRRRAGVLLRLGQARRRDGVSGHGVGARTQLLVGLVGAGRGIAKVGGHAGQAQRPAGRERERAREEREAAVWVAEGRLWRWEDGREVCLYSVICLWLLSFGRSVSDSVRKRESCWS